MTFPEHINPTERRIISALIKRGLAAGYKISVHDGEEFAIVRSTDFNAIAAEVAATDETRLLFRNANNDRIGTISLVHGNADDVICDHTDNDAMQALVEGVW